MRFSIVTPSYKQPEWLRLCAASVADQDTRGLEVEHLVQDSLSGPEIAEAISAFPQVKLISEKDQGMYDAIVRGWAKSTGDILSWLNCDEQLLPGTLQAVAAYFEANPDVDVLFGDSVVVDAEGKYMCSRQVITPLLYHTWTCNLMTLSCSTYFRRRVLWDKGFNLDTRWRDLGDAELIVRMLRGGVRMGYVRRYLASFVDTGDNRNLRPLARQEHATLASQAPAWAQALPWFWTMIHRLRRLAHGLYRLQPFSYDSYSLTSPGKRVQTEVPHPTFYWKSRMELNSTP